MTVMEAASSRKESGSMSISEEKGGNFGNVIDDTRTKSGLNVRLAAFFMIAQMAGAGFLSLPRAMANTGWIGIFMMFMFCCMVAFSATRLGLCWIMLEERYPEYRMPARQPYVEIASRSLGPIGRKLATVLMLITNIGSTTVFIILIAELFTSVVSALSICEWCLIVVAVIIPLAWLGTPKDFWQASVFAVLSTLLAILIIIVEIFLQYEEDFVWPEPEHPFPTVSSFSLGFGAILFAFGGSSVFPTIQNDMQDRTLFWKSILISFAAIVTMYFPVALFGYIYIGDAVDDNVILSLASGPAVTVAIIFEIFNLLGTFIISMSPVFQYIEDRLNIPREFSVKRVGFRTGLILCQLFVALAFPDFGLILNLIGGSSMSILSFILPPLMFMKLVDDKSNPEWKERSIPKWQRVLLMEIMFIGVVGGISSTVSALIALLDPGTLSSSCFVHFGLDDE